MYTFESEGYEIAFDDEGEGDPTILLHALKIDKADLLGSFPSLPVEAFRNVCTPSLVIAGARDTVAGSPIQLAESIPGGKAVVVPGRSHLSCITDDFFNGAVMGFLGFR